MVDLGMIICSLQAGRVPSHPEQIKYLKSMIMLDGMPPMLQLCIC